MSYWMKYVEEEKKPIEIPKEEPKILSGIVYSHPHTKNIFYTEDELIMKTDYKLIQDDVDTIEPVPDSPLGIYKDDARNSLLNAYWHDFAKLGIFDALKHEMSFRVEKIRLINDCNFYLIPLTKSTPGILYHDSFLDIFPQRVQDAWKPLLEQNYKLVIMKKLPWMIMKDKFIIETVKKDAEYDLFQKA